MVNRRLINKISDFLNAMIITVKSIGNGITRYNAGEAIKDSAFGIGHGAVSVDNKNVAYCIVSACNIYTG